MQTAFAVTALVKNEVVEKSVFYRVIEAAFTGG
jgi:hypothetical protein